MKVLQVCAYAAPYEGNFIKSLLTLQNRLRSENCEMIFAFPESIAKYPWCQSLAEHNTVYFLPLERARVRYATYRALKKIFIENPDIVAVHSHFELYDLPLAVVTPKNVRLFWHLHDAILKASFSREVLRTIQYRYFSRRATLVSVCEKYRKQLVDIGFPERQSLTILNGIDLDRIQNTADIQNKEYDFLAFVWAYHCKGADIILDACEKLIHEGRPFKILLIGAEAVQEELHRRFPNGSDSIILGKAQTDVNNLYRTAKVFISASREETFSYSVCEAAYAGLSIISSCIEGLKWAESLPTVDFFESENTQELYEAMKKHLDSHDVSEEHIVRTQEIIRSSFSAEHWAEEVCRIYGL